MKHARDTVITIFTVFSCVLCTCRVHKGEKEEEADRRRGEEHLGRGNEGPAVGHERHRDDPGPGAADQAADALEGDRRRRETLRPAGQADPSTGFVQGKQPSYDNHLPYVYIAIDRFTAKNNLVQLSGDRTTNDT